MHYTDAVILALWRRPEQRVIQRCRATIGL